MDEVRTSLVREVIHIAGNVYRTLVRPIISMLVISVILYYIYTEIVCHHACMVPFICKYCPAQESEIPSYLPLVNQTENIASLAETLANGDVSAPMHCVKAKIAIIELRAQIIHSDIDKSIRDNIGEQMLELQNLTQTGADQLTIMLSSFGGALDTMKIYTQFLLEGLTKSKNSNNHRGRQLQIGNSETQATDTLTESFDDYMNVINQQVDKVLSKAQQAYLTLAWISTKFETIQDLNYKGKRISESELDQLEKDSFWSWLFGKDQVGIRKNQRNIKTLDEFNYFIRLASTNINGIITKLLKFKNEATNLKETAAALDSLQRISGERQLEIIKASLKRLTQSKQTFEKKIEQENQEN